jgi:hypothetical protein
MVTLIKYLKYAKEKMFFCFVVHVFRHYYD